MGWIWLWCLCAGSSGACATTNFSDSAFQSKQAPYEIPYKEPATRALLAQALPIKSTTYEHDPNAPRSKAELVLVATPFSKTAWGAMHAVPAYLLFAYINDAPAFDQQLAEFRELVLRVRPKRSR